MEGFSLMSVFLFRLGFQARLLCSPQNREVFFHAKGLQKGSKNVFKAARLVDLKVPEQKALRPNPLDPIWRVRVRERSQGHLEVAPAHAGVLLPGKPPGCLFETFWKGRFLSDLVVALSSSHLCSVFISESFCQTRGRRRNHVI